MAWSSVHIQCLCQIAAAQATGGDGGSAAAAEPSGPSTSLKQSGDTGAGTRELASTPPKILFCDLTLGPGETRTFDYEDLVPIDCPSTYHGRHFRYSYRIVVASQRIHRAIATLKLPIRVLAAPVVPAAAASAATAGAAAAAAAAGPENANKPSITNPFASKGGGQGNDDEDDDDEEGGEDEEGNTSSLKSILESSLVQEERKKATYYNITGSGGKKVGKLCLYKTSYRLGEDITGKSRESFVRPCEDEKKYSLRRL